MKVNEKIGYSKGRHEAKLVHSPLFNSLVLYTSVSQPPGRGPVPGPGINYTGPREVLLEFVILFF